jgi:hypothetical protein
VTFSELTVGSGSGRKRFVVTPAASSTSASNQTLKHDDAGCFAAISAIGMMGRLWTVPSNQIEAKIRYNAD